METFFVFLALVYALDDSYVTISNGNSTNCGQDLVVESFCYKECPDGYDQQGKFCSKKVPLLFTFKFFLVFDSFYHENLICYPESPHQLASVAIEKRGLFFGSSSNICRTKAQFLFGPKLLIVVWIRIFNSGNIFTISDNS